MRKSPNKLIVSLLFLVGLILLLWMQGVFHSRVGPQAVPIKSTPMHGQLYTVSLKKVLDWQERQALLVPSSAVNNIGQLETVQVAAPEGIKVRHIKTGQRYGPEVEILSGLQAGEKIILPPGQTP